MSKLLNNRILQHVAFWSFYVVFYFYNYRKDEPVWIGLCVTLVFLCFHLTFTYTQLYFLIPRFLLKKKILIYLVLTVLLTDFITSVTWIARDLIILPLRGFHHDYAIDIWRYFGIFDVDAIRSYFALYLIFGIAVSIKLVKKWYIENEQKEQLYKEKLSMELSMLKAQLHPHFLFNTLNNLYAMSILKSESTPKVVANLSDLLRYMLYECNEPVVDLNKELDLLKKYIELEKIRYGQQIEISMNVKGDTSNLQIAPLLLLPFVENSFKHGISPEVESGWINLNINIEGNKLYFHLTNSVSEEVGDSKTGGLGIQNVQRRLDILYPGNYTLALQKEEYVFVSKLELNLKFSDRRGETYEKQTALQTS